jgi:DNA polymerase-4
MSAPRKIIHIDMDAFFAAVEQRDFPQYRNKPLVIGGSPHSRGVVSTCSYEARQYGIHSAMPSAHAYRLCPQAIFVAPRFSAYQEASAHIRRIFYQYTALVEPLSLDEAYLDVSNSVFCKGSATLMAREIKAKIKQQTQLTASAGVSYNKFLAKIASDMDKPDGLYLITPEQGVDFSANLPVNKFHGIGKATFRKMQDLGIHTGQDLKACSLVFLQQHFGKAGLHYYNISRGIDLRPVTSNRTAQSIGAEITFTQDIIDFKVIFHQLQQLLIQALAKLKAKNLSARTLSIKIKYYNFVQMTRSHTVSNNLLTTSEADLSALLNALLKTTEVGYRKVRLVGIHLSTLQSPSSLISYHQLDLFNAQAYIQGKRI